jgi:para-nitrobenzyl esterase
VRAAGTIAAFGAIASLAAACAREEPQAPRSPDPDALRSLAQGDVIGFEGRFGAHNWLGLPFAAPPTGALRWRAPRPPEPWEGTREALAGGASCPQLASVRGGPEGEEPGEPIGSEDCLFANVFAPRFAPAELPRGVDRLPVMVWIHGGGNTIGDARLYDGGRLATLHELVVVVIQYRLGVFGWFSHPALFSAEDDALDRSGNWGTLDLVRALAWVRENAEAFGGDPRNITIFGESAGATNVLSLLVSPVAHGSFERAIAQSGGLRTRTRAEAEHLADASEPGDPRSSGEVLLSLLQADGAVDRSAAKVRAAAMKRPELAAYLRGKSADEILRVFEGGGFGGMYRIPTLIRDGAVVPLEEPEDLFARADGTAPVPAILGTNRDENKLFLLFGSEHVRRAFGFPLWF